MTGASEDRLAAALPAECVTNMRIELLKGPNRLFWKL
jgi:hypothetical protein